MDFPPVAAAANLQMELLTEPDDHQNQDEEKDKDQDHLDNEFNWDITDTDITVKMLRRRKDIREALVLGLREAFPERFGIKEEDEDAEAAAEAEAEPEDIPDEVIVEMMNMDPDVKATLLEILLELTDCVEQEGETTYYPSISDYSCAEEILQIEQVTGFRESREALPYKYEHLKTETISLIYSNPQILPLISRMKKEQIADALVLSALNVSKK